MAKNAIFAKVLFWSTLSSKQSILTNEEDQNE
jgi:hypothetical protein